MLFIYKYSLIKKMQKNNILNKKIISLFYNKISDKNNIISLNTDKNLGKIRHFPPANKEWINSIYSYNKNKIKFLPIKDEMLYKTTKSYFNFYDLKKQNNINIKNLQMRFKKLSILKIFVSNAEIKHTSSKAIITIYIYNRQKIYFLNKLNNFLLLNKLKERIKFVEKQNIKILEQIKEEKTLINCPIILQDTIKIYEDQRYKDFVTKSLEKEILTMNIKQLLRFNLSKFENTYLLKLNNIVKKIYDKKIEFNIVQLKYIYFNSDILTQSITLKLKRRRNSILKVLKKLFNLIKLSYLNKVTLINYIEKNIRKKTLNNIKIFNKYFNDKLNNKLFSLFNLNKEEKIENLILNSIKYKDISGLRLEAKGRLSKRRTASKSIFKLKYKGSLKNIDSSYKGLSTVILRGYTKSNIQFTKLSSKTRNGSFGIKGWISSK